MKKVLCMIDGLGSGGAQRQLVGLASLLKNKGYDVLFVWYNEVDFYRSYLEEHNVRYEQLTASNALMKAVKLTIAIIRFNPDAIVAYNYQSSQLACCLKILGLKSKIIVSERNMIQSIRCQEKVRFFLYRWADYIVSNAQAQTDFINNHFKKLRKKTRTIRNFVDSNYFIPSPSKNIETGNKKILVVGRIARQKNVIAFMQAVRKALDFGACFNVDWYGRVAVSHKDYDNEVKRVYSELELQDNMNFHQQTHNILEKYQECDVFCLPSFREGFPNAICEAMSCGKPILCSNIADNALLVHDGDNGELFSPSSVDDMADKLISFCKKTREELDKMGEESRKIVLDKLSEEKFVQQYISIIE
jgi:glycosyltransferase involved in cell wall biosynthesis